MANSLVFSQDELVLLTGYKWASKQLDSLKKAGFFRARLNSAGNVVLERAHYEFVCASQDATFPGRKKPKVRVPSLINA